MDDLPRSIRHLRWIYEFLLSLYCAFLIVCWEGSGGSHYVLFDSLQALLMFLDRLLSRLIHWRLFCECDFDPPLFYATWLFLGVILFFCLHTLGRLTILRTFLCHVAGIVAVAGPLYSDSYGINVWHLEIARRLQWLEVAVVVTCVLLYLYRKWTTSSALSIFVLLVHFGFWGLVLFGPAWLDYWWQASALLLLPFCVSLVWGLYVRRVAELPGRPEQSRA